jgi:hypothetical protein
VQIYDVSRHATLATDDIRPDGAFEIRGAPGGSYLVTVVNERGETSIRARRVWADQ